MHLKTFHGKNMTEIMAQIKKDLGDDAVIVSSRTNDDGTLRVTAALEENAAPEQIEVIEDWSDSIADANALFGGVYDYGALPDVDFEHTLEILSKSLQKHSLPPQLFDRILMRLEQAPKAKPDAMLAQVFGELFAFKPLDLKKQLQPLMLVGQPGAGKTTTLAKLATKAVMDGIKPVVITCDTVRAGGVEQLSAFTRVLQLELYKVHTPEQLQKALQDHAKADLILIDCPGLNSFDPAAMKELFAYTKAGKMDLVVTLPGGFDIEESAEIARAFAVLGAKYLLPTRLDMSRRLGGLLAAADQAQLAFVGIGNKPDIADGFAPLDALMLARLIAPNLTENKK